MSDRALRFAMTLSPDVIAIHLMQLQAPEMEEDGKALKQNWQAEIIDPLTAAGHKPPRLVLLPAPYREIHGPLLKLIDKIDQDTPGRSVAVLIPNSCNPAGGSASLGTTGRSDSDRCCSNMAGLG